MNAKNYLSHIKSVKDLSFTVSNFTRTFWAKNYKLGFCFRHIMNLQPVIGMKLRAADSDKFGYCEKMLHLWIVTQLITLYRRQGDFWPGRKKTNILGPISRSPNGDNKKSKWKKDKLSENEFQVIKSQRDSQEWWIQ